MTYTYAILEVSESTYQEIRKLLDEAGYQQAFHEHEDGEVVDMRGIALKARAEPVVSLVPQDHGPGPAPDCEECDGSGVDFVEDGVKVHPCPVCVKPIEPDVLYDLLGMVGDEIPGCRVVGGVDFEIEGLPTVEEISKWSPSSRREVRHWAISIHFRASDNDKIVVPPVPDVLKDRP